MSSESVYIYMYDAFISRYTNIYLAKKDTATVAQVRPKAPKGRPSAAAGHHGSAMPANLFGKIIL